MKAAELKHLIHHLNTQQNWETRDIVELILKVEAGVSFINTLAERPAEHETIRNLRKEIERIKNKPIEINFTMEE